MGLLSLLPVILFLGSLAVFAWIGYEMYVYSNQLADRGKRHLEKKNIVYTKDGVKVGVKDRKDEDLTDKSQSMLHKTWSLATSPESRPDLPHQPSDGKVKTTSSSRPSASRTSTGTSQK
ncbi:uncharacterized protein PV09_03403 [Verruconis gallopava]|uniref:Uncharacterized protein n=1 Tax=Verruconis gallopava TaxID=253628 RepID=A0A0D1YXY3_9PEZI|nr:uncharacterized protein PV09_03403 [Verruconis gallopava]KIW05522.1 hypothetical protein PV09_03403 [Verruconis gallopava]